MKVITHISVLDALGRRDDDTIEIVLSVERTVLADGGAYAETDRGLARRASRQARRHGITLRRTSPARPIILTQITMRR